MSRKKVYITLLLSFLVFIIIRIIIINIKTNQEITSIFNEWNKNGFPVSVYKINEKKLEKTIKISGVLKDKEIKTKVSEEIKESLKQGDTFYINETNYKGKITNISQRANNLLNMYEVTLSLDNNISEKTNDKILEINVIKNLGQKLAINNDAIITEKDKTYCWKVFGSKVKKVEIQLGLIADNFSEIKNGLVKNDIVVTEGQNLLKNDSQINIYKTIGE